MTTKCSSFDPDVYDGLPSYVLSNAWEAAGRPPYDRQGRELDVRGAPTNRGNWPDLLAVHVTPAGTPEQETYRTQLANRIRQGLTWSEGDVPKAGFSDQGLEFAAWHKQIRGG